MNKFSVSNEIDTYIVNLEEKTCACRKWDLASIPCAHAIVCIRHNGLAFVNNVHLTIGMYLSIIFICFGHYLSHMSLCLD